MLRLLRYTRRDCVDNMSGNLANLSLKKTCGDMTYSSSRGNRHMSGTELTESRMFSIEHACQRHGRAVLVNAK